MFDWIVEADIYRLRKEAREASDSHQQCQLEEQAVRKAAVLAKRHASAGDGAAEQG